MICRVCHRPLSDPVSLSLGIGPTCRARGHTAPLQMSLFDAPEGEGGEDATHTATFWSMVEVLQTEDDSTALRGQGQPMALVDHMDVGRPGPIIRYPIRAPWWVRWWRWVRGLAR